MALFSFFHRFFPAATDRCEGKCRDVLAHPQIERMDQRALADLQFRPVRFIEDETADFGSGQ